MTVLAAAAATAVVTAGSAQAAGPTKPLLTGTAAGTVISAVGGAITSGSTASSGLETLSGGQTDANTIASASVPNVLTVGAVNTSTTSTAVPGGLSITSHARTAGVNLLHGLITAQAIDTTDTATLAGGVVSSQVSTNIVGLKVAGLPVKLNVAKNTKLSIPGVLTVVVNYAKSTPGSQSITTSGAGLVVTLLTGALKGAVGSIVEVNPVTANISQVGLGYAPLGGQAFATEVTAHVGGAVSVILGPTGATKMPPEGTGGQNVSNNTAAVNLPGLAVIGAVGSTANGIATGAGSRSTENAHVANVNLLNGLITADALDATAQVLGTGTLPPVVGASATIVNLTIAGNLIPVDAAPNTVINLGGLGFVTINGQVKTANSVAVAALDVHLTTASFGLPVGADVIVGFAQASFLP